MVVPYSTTIAESDSIRTGLPVSTLTQKPTAALSKSGKVRIMVEMVDPPAAALYGERLASEGNAPETQSRAVAEAKAQLAGIERSQAALRTSLAAPEIGAKVLFQAKRVYNGVAVSVDAENIERIKALPGVKAVHLLVPKHPNRGASVPLINARKVWNSSGLNAKGEGITIGVIDTGIDYFHTDFGGSGTGYDTNDPTIIDAGFPSAKVVGGYDFVGDSYDAGDPDNDVPNPDPDPYDCGGHGTHVAGIAAGLGVKGNGSTYTGPWEPTANYNSLRIPPGVAPQASLYALKVFGCSGTTNVVVAALEWAVDPNEDGDFSDHLDVVNMSLGSPLGRPDDPDVDASDNAAKAGVIVVASAGNNGDTYFITGSPGSAARAISVANSLDNLAITSAFQVTDPASIAKTYAAAEAEFGPDLTTVPDVSGSLIYPSSNANGCGASFPEDLTGKIALIDRGSCSFQDKVQHAQDAGAIGVLVVNYDNTAPFAMSAVSDPSAITIPSMMTLNQIGATLKTALATEAVTVVLTGKYHNGTKLVDKSWTDSLAASSSRGPRNGDCNLKPDIAAPGDTIFSGRAGSGNDGISMGGTSMAAPHIAGAMALLRELHPKWTVEQLKALVMNTALHDLFTGFGKTPPKFGPGRVGAGRADLYNAGKAEVVAYDDDGSGAVSVSFGAPAITGQKTLKRTVRVKNFSKAKRTFDLSYAGMVDIPGVRFTFPKSVAVAAKSSKTFTVTMTVDATKMKHTIDPSVPQTQSGISRHWLSEEAGYINFKSKKRVVMRLPVYAAPRPASQMKSQSVVSLTGATGSVNLDLTGTPVNTGTDLPLDEVSLVSPFELQGTTAKDLTGFNLDADLEAVGIRAINGSDPANASILFGIGTYGPWSSPSSVEYDIYVDTNRDGTNDYLIFNYGYPNDWFAGSVCPLPTGACKAYYVNAYPASDFDTVLFNSSAMVFYIPASDIGLTSGSTKFDYYVVSYDLHTFETNKSRTFTYDIAHPGLDFGGTFLYDDLPGTSIPVEYNVDDMAAAKSKGILLLHHHNRTAQQTQKVKCTVVP
jgi:subtilisin family serine protease